MPNQRLDLRQKTVQFKALARRDEAPVSTRRPVTLRSWGFNQQKWLDVTTTWEFDGI